MVYFSLLCNAHVMLLSVCILANLLYVTIGATIRVCSHVSKRIKGGNLGELTCVSKNSVFKATLHLVIIILASLWDPY